MYSDEKDQVGRGIESHIVLSNETTIYPSMLSTTVFNATFGFSKSLLSHCFSPDGASLVIRLRPRSVVHSTRTPPVAGCPSTYASSICSAEYVVSKGTVTVLKSADVISSIMIFLSCKACLKRSTILSLNFCSTDARSMSGATEHPATSMMLEK